MRKKVTKVLSLVLALTMIVGLVPTTAFAQNMTDETVVQEVDEANSTEEEKEEASAAEETADVKEEAETSGEEKAEAADEKAEPQKEEKTEEPIKDSKAMVENTKLGFPSGAYNRVVSQKNYSISPGVKETNAIVNDSSNSNQNTCFMLEVDLSDPNASVIPSYNDMNPKVWKTAIMSKQAADAERVMGVNVVGGVNVNLSWQSEEPVGMLVVNGEVWHNDTSYRGNYLAIDKNGKAEFRNGNVPLKGNEWQAISSIFDTWLIKNGKTMFPTPDHATVNREPRTALGIKADGSLVLFEVDGRQTQSVGMTMHELAEAMLAAGCVSAINCDGGGSSTFLSEREGSGKLTVKNSPSDGVERPSLSGLLVVSNAKPTGVFDHAAITPNEEYFTPNSQIQFKATGVDSTGTKVDLPADVSWDLAKESKALGQINASTGLFKANAGAVGVVTVNMKSGGKVVGSAQVELVNPDEVRFAAEEMSFGFNDTKVLEVIVRYHGVDVNYKASDLLWSVSDAKLGTLDKSTGTFTSSDGESLNGYVTITSAFNSALTSKIHLIVGMLPTLVWDFEDVKKEDGTVIPAKEYYTGSKGILSTSNYGRGGKESIEIVSIDDEEPVRLGSHSLKLNYDFTNCGAVTEGANIGTSEGMTIPGAPTGIGVWVYAPEGVGVKWEGDGTQAGFWLRGYVKDGTGKNQPYDFTLEPKAVTGDQQPGIYWEGWKYLEADLTKLPAPYSIQPGMTFRLMYVFNTKMGTKSAGSIYFDNLQFVYGANVDDVSNPVVRDIQLDRKTLKDGAVLNSNDLGELLGSVYDVQNKYTSGIDMDTFRMYIDGVNVTDDKNFDYAVNESAQEGYLYNLHLLNGEHSITVSARDKAGNEVSETRHFTVAGKEDANVPKVTVKPKEKNAVLGEHVNLNIQASDASKVQSNVTQLKIDKKFPDYKVTFANGFEGTTKYNKITGVLTITANRKDGANVNGNVIATVSVAVPATLKENMEFQYEVKSGKYVTSDNKVLTYSTKEQRLPVASFYTVTADKIIVGQPGKIYVKTADGVNAPNVGIYKEDGTLLGNTDKNGELKTDAFSATAGKYVVYAKDAAGKLSFHYNVESFNSAGEGKLPFGIKHNASANGVLEESFSWMTNPTEAKVQQLQYAKQDAAKWTTVNAETELCTFIKEGNSIVAVHNAMAQKLAPNTTYKYRVGYGDNWSKEKTFTTGAVDEDTTFFALGDIQAEDLTNIQAILGNVKSGYEFGIQTGDGVDDATSYANWTDLTNLFGNESINDTDMIHVLGNHEFAGDEFADRAEAIYGLPNNGMGSCYSVTYDNVYVAVINYTGNKAQLQSALEWLKKDAAKSDCMWKVLTMHQPPYYTNVAGGNAEINQLVPPVVDELGIDFVFSGHDHSYARTEPLKGGKVNKDGAVYFICGSSGEKSYEVIDTPEFHFAKATPEYDAIYLDVHATRDEMKVTAYNVKPDGTKEIFDTYTKDGPYCKNDEHTYVFDRKTGILDCSECEISCNASETLYLGWATDKATGKVMYFVGGEYVTGYQKLFTGAYYFDENGLGYEGEFTICGEKCKFAGGQYVSCSTAKLMDAGWAGEKVEYVVRADGTLQLAGSGTTTYFNNHGNRPFKNCAKKITSIVVGKDITYLSGNIFAYLPATSITFEEGSKVHTIGYCAFYTMPYIKEIVLPESVTGISTSAFARCPKLEKVVVPPTVKHISTSAFKQCDNLVLYVAKDSYAMNYAIENKIKYKVIEIEVKNGIYEEDGRLVYYQDGAVFYAGLIKIDDDYYYVRSNGELAIGEYWVTKTNGLLPEGKYTFGTDGKMITGEPEPPKPEEKNGIYEVNGKLVYFKDGEPYHAGLIKIDGDYYYARSNGELAIGKYWVSKTNNLLPEGWYVFGTDGKMIVDEPEPPKPGEKNGIFEENGKLVYYRNGSLYYAGLIEIDGDYYYVRSNGQLAIGDYWVTKTNGRLPEGKYTFGADGKMMTGTSGKKNGIYKEEGKLVYYKDGYLYYAGLIKLEGDYYYVRSNGELAVGDYWVTKTNDLLPEGKYTFGTDGKMVTGTSGKKNGIHKEDGKLVYYKDGSLYYAGLIKVDGDYYYVRSNGQLAIGDYWVSKTNDLLPSGKYTFGTDGKMITNESKPGKDGICKEDGKLVYYKDGQLYYAGLIKVDGNYYYVRSNGQLAIGKYWVTKTNNLLPSGNYTFGNDGKMLR